MSKSILLTGVLCISWLTLLRGWVLFSFSRTEQTEETGKPSEDARKEPIFQRSSLVLNVLHSLIHTNCWVNGWLAIDQCPMTVEDIDVKFDDLLMHSHECMWNCECDNSDLVVVKVVIYSWNFPHFLMHKFDLTVLKSDFFPFEPK